MVKTSHISSFACLYFAGYLGQELFLLHWNHLLELSILSHSTQKLISTVIVQLDHTHTFSSYLSRLGCTGWMGFEVTICREKCQQMHSHQKTQISSIFSQYHFHYFWNSLMTMYPLYMKLPLTWSDVMDLIISFKPSQPIIGTATARGEWPRFKWSLPSNPLWSWAELIVSFWDLTMYDLHKFVKWSWNLYIRFTRKDTIFWLMIVC